jgi:hypothetical protein
LRRRIKIVFELSGAEALLRGKNGGLPRQWKKLLQAIRK